MDVTMTGSVTVAYHGVYIEHPIGGGNARVVLPPSSIYTNIFTAGSHYWSARFICHHKTPGGDPGLFLSLHHWSRGFMVKASWELSVIDPVRGSLAPTTLWSTPPLYFMSWDLMGWELDYDAITNQCIWYVHDRDPLQLLITVTVVDDPAETTTTTIEKQIDVDVPPSDLLDQLGEMFKTRDGADVTFSVDGELIAAHKIVLAMRSRVFKAQLYGGEMKESWAQPIEIRDMTPDTFRTLLHYIYTDSLPASSSSSNQQGEEDEEGSQDNDKKVWELLMAADLYSVERLKLILERVLCKRLDVDNVAEMLRRADRHHCGTLKDACIEFMTTSQRMGEVNKSQAFLQLKDSNPRLLVEVLEKSSKFSQPADGIASTHSLVSSWKLS